MINFIDNIGEYFASNYFDDDFTKKAIDKSGYSADAMKLNGQKILALKPMYFALKQRFMENKLRVKDKVNLTNTFHTRVLSALGYDANNTNYNNLYHIDDRSALPIRHILYRGNQPHLMIMEMHALIAVGDEVPDGLFEQQYTSEEQLGNKTQKYHRSQWEDIFTVPEDVKISPKVINKAVSELFLLPPERRPRYILLCAGNKYFLLETEKWQKGSYLILDLELLFDEAVTNRYYLGLFYTLLCKEMLAPEADLVLMDQLDEDSHKSAYEVTKDLKEGVIHAIEALANEAVHYLTNEKGISLDSIDANLLKDDCLTMVYRLLFLFYAESREELDILPSNDEVYTSGYSLEMLRDLEQVPLQTASSKNGYFFHQSIIKLFELLNDGYRDTDDDNRSFRIRQLDSPMFDNDNLHYLADVEIRNYIWQDVICELSLSKKQHNKSRGRISYSNLGINQLGSVYESLLAFRGFLAETDYIEVHSKRTRTQSSEQVVSKDGSFLTPRHRLGDFHIDEVYHDVDDGGNEVMRIIPQGTFIYRLSGRDRQKSASYYTPESLTQTTVKYTLKPILERLDDESANFKALDLLQLKILEPAMGAAAFHNEVINQLADAYLTRRQLELNRRVEPDKYIEELQKVKTYIALNNIYGVDINPTAIELGKLSLWLNVIHKDMQTPFFGYRLGLGNAVIGAWFKTYNVKDVNIETTARSRKAIAKKWWKKAPTHLEFGKRGIKRRENELYHFLLPDNGMVASANIKLLRDEYPAEAKRVKEWKQEFTQPLSGEEVNLLKSISVAIDKLITEHYEWQESINLLVQPHNNFFGAIEKEQDGQGHLLFDSYDQYEQKEALAKKRYEANAPYYKLKMIMDYWSSLWFWDVREAKELPTRTDWYNDIRQILNIDLSSLESVENGKEYDAQRDYRKDKREAQKQIVEALKEAPTSLFSNQRAELVKEYASQYKFFHYELEFIEVFYESNGFDIAVGNPPWISVDFDEKGVISEMYPEVEIRKTTSPQIKKIANKILPENKKLSDIYIIEDILAESTKRFLGSVQNYSLLQGQRNNLYKCVVTNVIDLLGEHGFAGLLHPEVVFLDAKAEKFRKAIYPHVLFHFRFRNELRLFSEVGNYMSYSVNIYKGRRTDINFSAIFNLFHPQTIDSCFTTSSKEISGLKIKTQKGFEWNLNGSIKRIIRVNNQLLATCSKVFENGDENSAPLPSINDTEISSSIEKLFSGIKKKKMDWYFTDGFNETNAINNNQIKRNTKIPNFDNYEMIYSGPHFFVANPMYQTPKEVCNTHRAYEILDPNFAEINLQRTNYIPDKNFKNIETLLWGESWLESYKLAFSKMINLTNSRSLQSCIIPPKSSHINSVVSLVFKDVEDLLFVASLTSSLPFDFILRISGVSNLYESIIRAFPIPTNPSKSICTQLYFRYLKAVAADVRYNKLLQAVKNEKIINYSKNDERLGLLSNEFLCKKGIKNFYEQRYVQIEIDVLSSMLLGLTLDELIQIYEVQFSVDQQNEAETFYDKMGNIIFTTNMSMSTVGVDRPMWNIIKNMKAGETYEHTIEKSELYYGQKITYHAPFEKCDRVEDYKVAWEHFEKVFNK